MVHLWRAESSYTTEVEKKFSDERGFILTEKMDGWLFKNKPKTDFLYSSLWVNGLTVELLSSKIIKSYLLSANFQIGKHTWQYLVIRAMSKVLKNRIQKVSWILCVRIKFWCHKVHWYLPLLQQDGKLLLRERAWKRKRSRYNRKSGSEKKRYEKEIEKKFTVVSKFGSFFSKLIVTQYNSQEWSWVTSFVHPSIHSLLSPTNAQCLLCDRHSARPWRYRV